jgi:hypothetical protein
MIAVLILVPSILDGKGFESLEHFFTKMGIEDLKSRTTVQKLCVGKLEDSSFNGIPLENDLGRLSLSLGIAGILWLLSHQLFWRRLGGFQSSYCPLLGCTSSHSSTAVTGLVRRYFFWVIIIDLLIIILWEPMFELISCWK